ncbi:MAG: hypothetical protein ACOCUW_01920 [Gemmatimonadota bacterium]
MRETPSHYPEHMTRDDLERRGARFCADCHSHHEYALLQDQAGLAAYRMEDDDGHRVAEAVDGESAAQLGRLVDHFLVRTGTR